LHEGQVRFLGTLDEMESFDDPYVKQFLERRPDEERLDADQYLDELMGE
jgi:ABC-type transporter Mla maintaining outer membrane lipid asymmetry ATPase subunit MlaF